MRLSRPSWRWAGTVASAAAVLAATAATSDATSTPAAADPRLERAAAAIGEERGDDAAALIGEVVDEHGRVAAFTGLSARLVATGQTASALGIALGNARAWLREGDADDAVALLAPLAAHAPGHAALRALLGEAHLRAGNASTAVDHLEAAVAAGDASAGTRFHLASALWEAGRLDAAEDLLRAGAEASGGGAAGAFVWHHARGRLLHFLGRSAEAAAVLTQAVAARPQAVDAQLDLAWALESAGDAAGATAAFERAIALDRSLAKAHYGLARLRARAGDRERAAASMATFEALYRADRAREAEAATARARLDLGWHLLRRGDADQAAERFAALGDLSEALDGLAAAREAVGDAAGAVDALERAVRQAPDDQRLRRRLAAARLALGDGTSRPR